METTTPADEGSTAEPERPSDLDMRFAAAGFRLSDLLVALIAFDRRECGENSSFSYIVPTEPYGTALLESADRAPRARLAKLVRAIEADAGWLFLPFCVFGDDQVRCADGARVARRPPRERGDDWLSRARSGDCAGVIVGRDGATIVARPAFNGWSGGDSVIAVLDELGGLRGPLRAFVASFAKP